MAYVFFLQLIHICSFKITTSVPFLPMGRNLSLPPGACFMKDIYLIVIESESRCQR
jgi:hypothetical protein